MSKHSTEHLAKFEAAFQKYLDVHMTGRNLELLKEMLTEDFCGYGTGLDENFYGKNRGIEIFQRNITSAPNKLHYTLHHYEIKLLDQYNAIVVTELDLKTKIMGQDVKLNDLRMMMVLHEEDSIVKISGIHISFPTEVHKGDESYPLKELEERTQVLSRMVDEKTKNLQQEITERKRTEEALRESESKLKLMMETIPAAIFLTKGNHTEVDYCNAYFTTLFGYSYDDIPTLEKWFELAYPDETYRKSIIEETMDYLNKSIADRSYFTQMYSNVTCKDGSQKYILWQGFMLGNQWLCCGFDLTKTKETEEELEERIKELKLLNLISSAVQEEESCESICQKLTYAMPNAWLYPEIACIRILCEGQQYQTDNFRETVWRQAADLKVKGKKIGVIELYYSEERPFRDEGPFLKEERTLINLIAERLGSLIERLHAEKTVRESELILKDILETTLSGFWDWNLVDNTEYLSPTFKRMFGYEDHEMENSPEAWQRLIFPEDLPGVLEAFDRHVESRGLEPFYNEVRYRHRDGSTVWVICTGRVIEWAEDGTATRMIGCHIDITQRKRAEETLRESETRFRDLVDATPDYIYSLDRESRHTAVNRSICEAMGLEEHEIIGKNHRELGFPEDICNDWRELHRKVFSTKQTVKAETSSPMPNGTIHIYEVVLTPVFDENSSVIGIRGISRDITEQRKVEAEHVKISSEYETVFQSTQDAKFLVEVVDQETFRFIRNNLAHSRATGLDPKEIQGKTPEELLGEELGATINANYKRCVQQQEPISYEETLSLPGGTRIWSTVLTPVIEDGEVLYIVGSCRDITESKQAERDIQNLLENAPDMIIRFNRDLKHIYCNKAVENYFGVPREYFFGKTFADLARGMEKKDESTFEIMSDTLKQCLESREEQHVELWFDVHGEKKYFSTRVVPEFNSVGHIESLLAVTRDTTTRKYAEERVKESEERLNTFISKTPAVIYSYNVIDGMPRINYVNENVKDVLGFEPEDFINNHNFFVECLHPEDAQKVLGAIPELLAEGRVTLEEYRFRDRQGNYHWLHDEQQLITHEDGTQEVIGAWWDMTERKQIENALEEYKERLALAQTISQAGTWEYDINNESLYWSKECEALFGLAEGEFEGTFDAFLKRVHPDDRDYVVSMNQPITESKDGINLDYEHRIIKEDGTVCWVRESAGTISDKSGKPLKIVGFIMDITKQKKAEEQIRHISFHDSLTGLYNRRYIEEEMKRLDTERQLPISIIMVDLNGLKLVNDTYGHEKGDELLKCTAEILKKPCREEDIVARWGGDEFVIIFPQTTVDETNKICKRIIRNCKKAYVNDVPISIALGFACKDRSEKDLTKVLKEAEDNMYKHKLTEDRSAKNAVLKAFLKTLAEKSYETEGHVLNMQRIARAICKKLDLPDSELSRLELVITLHDIGKINIAEEVLTKEGPLTREEWEIIKRHPEIGFRITRATAEFAHVAEDILAHHERWDGSGYPMGLKGKDIPLLARITAIADAYEVMRNGRPYKESMSKSEIVEELKRCSGSQFDPELVAIFLSILAEGEID